MLRPRSSKCSATKASRCISGSRFSVCRAGPDRPSVSKCARRQAIKPIDGSDLLVAAGRTPNTDGIGLDVAGVVLDDRGYIAVNDRLETSAPDVLAIGEAAGSPQFTHVSFDDFRIISANLSGGTRTKRDRLVPYCMFTDPPLARVGLSEDEAQRQGIAVRVAKMPARVSSVGGTGTSNALAA